MIFLIKSSKLNEQPILIINNTPSFLNMANKVSPQVTIDTIRKIYASHPELNLGIVNTRSANIGFKIIDSYCKYAILK